MYAGWQAAAKLKERNRIEYARRRQMCVLDGGAADRLTSGMNQYMQFAIAARLELER